MMLLLGYIPELPKIADLVCVCTDHIHAKVIAKKPKSYLYSVGNKIFKNDYNLKRVDETFKSSK